MKKTTTLLFALAILFAMPVFSQSSKNEKVKQLFALMQTDKMIDKTFEQMVSALSAQMKAQSNGNAEAEKTALDRFEKMMNISKETARLLVNDLSEIYGKYYTDEDLDVLIEFYQSPTGKKTIEMQPQLTKEMMTLMTTKYMPQMQAKMQEEMKKENDVVE